VVVCLKYRIIDKVYYAQCLYNPAMALSNKHDILRRIVSVPV